MKRDSDSRRVLNLILESLARGAAPVAERTSRTEQTALLVTGFRRLAIAGRQHNETSAGMTRAVAEAVLSWLRFCASINVVDIDGLLLQHYPGYCPYCLKRPHDAGICQGLRDRVVGTDHSDHADMHAVVLNWTLADWQQEFYGIYPTSKSSKPWSSALKVFEELSEVCDSFQHSDDAGLRLELADLFARLMHFQNVIDSSYLGEGGHRGAALAESVADLIAGESLLATGADSSA